MNENQKTLAAGVLSEIAQSIRTGQIGPKIRIGLTTVGSEIDAEQLVQGGRQAVERDPNLELVVIGDYQSSDLSVYKAHTDEEAASILESLLDRGELDGVVTMHYPFPIGVSTVGKVVTPARGNNMYIATTTGTSDTNRVQAMVKNAVYGIAAAKADGIANPRVGILNVEGARQVERHLTSMQKNGYEFTWGQSQRADGGRVLRGNDLIMGSVDVLVTDTLTGNVLIKLFSSFTSGGDYETTGCGYGPGIGDADFNRIICILSRASGTPVVRGAVEYCAQMVKGHLLKIKNTEIQNAKKSGWTIQETKNTDASAAEAEIVAPSAKVCDSQIAGIDILELDDAVKALWKNNVFASSGMGCTGPVILVSRDDLEEAKKILSEKGYL